MKINILRSGDRGVTEIGWLHSLHSFSFGSYHDPKRMGFGLLRVFNDDIVKPSKGFGTHYHENFEIISIVLGGSLEHRDSMGNHGIIKAGEIQRISAGSGISHSEFNHSSNEKAHFLQIWVKPKDLNTKQGYEQKNFSILNKNEFVEIISGEHNPKTIFINQDCAFSLGIFDKQAQAIYILKNKKNGAYIFVIEGGIEIEKKQLELGDSAQITGAGLIRIRSARESKVLAVEMPLD